MNVEHWPIAKIVPYARNARIAPEAAIAKVAASIKEFGWRQPIVVDEEGVILAGHTRLLAAQRLGFEEIPVHVATGLTATQARAFRLMDNRSAQETSWDPELLPLEFSDLADLDFDLSLSGFEPDEIAAFLATANEGRCDPDEIVPPPEDPISKPGDLWCLGAHRLLCGDSTRPEDVGRLMAGERAGLMATDPPYLVDYDGNNHLTSKGGAVAHATGPASQWDKYTDHENSVVFYRAFLEAALAEALNDCPSIYQWFATMRCEVVFAAWREAGLLLHQVLIWDKGRSILGHTHYMWDYEPMAYGWKQGRKPRRKPPAAEKTTWHIACTEGNEENVGHVHPTIKPVETVRRCIEFHTRPGELIYEPFSGSGTAIIAAEMTGRHCYAMEISPGFVDAAVLRWERFTGKQATIESHGPH